MMNKSESLKRRKSQKRGLKTVTKDGEAEIFVLPPHLLQKLGINLGSVENILECPTDNTRKTDIPAPITVNSEEKRNSNIAKESTILETADLMKKSVFLSPTFVTTASNVNYVDEEIANVSIQLDNDAKTITDVCQVDPEPINLPSNDIIYTLSDFQSDAIPVTATLNNNIKSTDHQLKEKDLNMFSPSRGQNLISLTSNTKSNIPEKSRVVSTEDHPDEAYLSDCSNSNLGPLETTEVLSYIQETDSNNIIPNNSKINIISEEILTPTQIKELKILHSSKLSDLVSVPVNTVLITGNEIKKNMVTGTLAEHNLDEKFNKIESTSIQNNLENVILFDEKGDVIGTSPNDMKSEISIEMVDTDHYSEDTKKYPTVDQDSLNKSSTHDNSLGVCIDLEVSDIEKHLKENEEILEHFVNEITSNDNNEILAEIEKSEKECFVQLQEVEVLPKVTGNIKQSKIAEIISLDSSIQTADKGIVRSHGPMPYLDGLVLDNENSIVSNNLERPSTDCMTENDCIELEEFTCQSDRYCNGLLTENEDSNKVFKDRLVKNIEEAISKEAESIDEYVMHIKQRINERINVKDNLKSSTIIDEKRNEISVLSPSMIKKESELNDTTDKVKEIAMYLTQFAKHRENFEKDKIKSDKVAAIPIKQTTHNTLKSKLRIQGVEKPGGIEGTKENTDNVKHPKIIVTYGKAKKTSVKPCTIASFSTYVCHDQMQYTQNTYEKTNTEYNIVQINNSRTTEFCLCGDFGTLTFYDKDSLYEHIHFWEHQKIENDPEILFSMYHEDYKDDKSASEIYADETETTEENVQSICWRSFENNNPKTLANRHITDVAGQIREEKSKICIDKHVVNKEFKKADDSSVGLGDQIDAIDVESNTTGSELKCSTSKQTRNPDTEKCSLRDDKSTEEIVTIVEIVEDTKRNAVPKSKVVDHSIPNELVTTENEVQCKNATTTEIVKKTSKQFDVKKIQEPTDLKKRYKKSNMEKSEDNDPGNSPSTEECDSVKIIEETICNKKGKKRKHSSDFDDEDDKPLAKTTVKCGVCEIILPNSKWEDHASQEHSFIAWKAGSEDFDWDDPKLMVKLQARIRENKSLPCPFCSEYVQNRFAKRFLSHVKKCWKSKNLDETNTTMDETNTTMNETNITIDAINKTINETNTAINETNTTSDETNYSISEAKGDRKNMMKVSTLSDTGLAKCGVCDEEIETSRWLEHSANKHDYLSWKVGEPSVDLDDEDEVKKHLCAVIKQIGELKCSKCGLRRRYAKAFMLHQQKCEGVHPVEKNAAPVVVVSETMDVKCGVCSEEMKRADWIDHIRKKHDYLAWHDGDTPLDVTSEDDVKEHLNNISKNHGGLICNKCGLHRKYVKSYLHHYRSCDGIMDESIKEIIKQSTFPIAKNCMLSQKGLVKCGVCNKYIAVPKWIKHIGRYHDYMAWKEGESLDLNDEAAVHDHLFEISKIAGGLECSKCGIVRRYVKSYLTHTKECDAQRKDYASGDDYESYRTMVCAVCNAEVDPKKWVDHKMTNHYNIAWAVGEPEIDYRSSFLIERLIKEYRTKYKKLMCKNCKKSRVSCIGFYAHIVTCGKTEEEIDLHKRVCEICNNKYLCIYHSQHMTWHREQGYVKERRLRAMEQAEEKKAFQEVKEEEDDKTGRRKAAQKAKKVIENYKTEMGQYTHKCTKCGFGADDKAEMDSHECVKNEHDYSDSDESAKVEEGSSDESAESEVDNTVSDEEDLPVKRKFKEHTPAYAKVPRFPYTPKNIPTFLKKSSQDFYECHLTSERLYSEWSVSDYEPVSDEELTKYMPPIEESCKIKLPEDPWITIKRFEAAKGKGIFYAMFVGTCVKSISWVPSVPLDEDTHGHYLSIIGPNSDDCPRYEAHETPAHPGLIQIWNFGEFKNPPEFVMGIAHDFGIAWAMDWCPSGARDILPDELECPFRLGLLAVAFSNGYAYIFSVPYPSSVVKENKLIYKLKPVAELRLNMGSVRKLYQATSITWSTQKENNLILVGYSDGTVGYFDLKTESPFLKTKENGLTIFYPYHDDRPHNTCITGVNTYPSSEPWSGGLVCAGSPAGGQLAARPASRPARVHTYLTCCDVVFNALWPAAALVSDDIGTAGTLNELELWGGGRRLGAACALAACGRCARAAAATAPAVRLLNPHPVNCEIKKQVIAAIQMTSLGKKRKKLQEDELVTKLQPGTYKQAVLGYGIEVRVHRPELNRKGKSIQPELYPERFPLADVASMAFCPSSAHHNKLAIATFSGVVLVIYV